MKQFILKDIIRFFATYLSVTVLVLAVYVCSCITANAQSCSVYEILQSELTGNKYVFEYRCNNVGTDPCASTFVNGTIIICTGELELVGAKEIRTTDPHA